MILGIGVDILTLSRIEEIKDSNYRDKFAKRILTDSEFNDFIKTSNEEKKVFYLGKRWSCKEAISKAFGCGIGETLSFRDIEIFKEGNEVPRARILKNSINSPNFSGYLNKVKINISVSDCKDYCNAFCVLEFIN